MRFIKSNVTLLVVIKEVLLDSDLQWPAPWGSCCLQLLIYCALPVPYRGAIAKSGQSFLAAQGNKPFYGKQGGRAEQSSEMKGGCLTWLFLIRWFCLWSQTWMIRWKPSKPNYICRKKLDATCATFHPAEQWQKTHLMCSFFDKILQTSG